MTIRLFLDTRRQNDEYPVRLLVSMNCNQAVITTSVKLAPEQWDKDTERVINHPMAKQLNVTLSRFKYDAEQSLYGKKYKTAQQAKNIILGLEDETLFIPRFQKFADLHKPSTRNVYLQTLRRMRAFDKDVDSKPFDKIDREWLTKFQNFLAETNSPNALAIHLRNIRAVFNDAIDDNITQYYPFRKFKIKHVQTAKRSLTIEQLRDLFSRELPLYLEKYRDIFKLMFYLIGINVADLYNLKEIRNGRIEYHRAKTGRLYSIKVEPEALEIIRKYKGKSHLLYIADDYVNHLNYISHINKALKKITPNLSTYWSRHTWATIAAELDIPKETIAAALGHSSNTVTDIYIRFDERKIDEANRKVIDYVLKK